jgi:hypothetical protein
LRRDVVEHFHHGQVAELVGRFGERFLGVASEPASTSSVTCLLSGQIAFVTCLISILIEHLGEIVARGVFIVDIVAVVIGRQLFERLVVVVPQARILVQEGRDDGLARQVRHAVLDGRVHAPPPLRRTRPWQTRGRVAELVVFASASKPFGSLNSMWSTSAKASMLTSSMPPRWRIRHQRIDHALVVLAIRRIAQDAFDLAFLARLIGELGCTFLMLAFLSF